MPNTRSWESPISGESSDHAEWAERGFTRAISLLHEKPKVPSLPARILVWTLRVPDPAQFEIDHVHTASDTIEVIHPQISSETFEICDQYQKWIFDQSE